MDIAGRSRVRARRELVRQGFGELYDALHQILLQHNPIGLDLTHGGARDDYGGPVGTIIPRLGAATGETIQDVVWTEMTRWYGDAGGREHYGTIASDVWRTWREFVEARR